METSVVKLDPSSPDPAAIAKAAALIDAGGLVAFPTETVYGIACRVRTDSLARLDEAKGRGPDKHYTVHIGRKEDVGKYVPRPGLKVKKLVERAWPGPLTLVFDLAAEDIEKQRGSLEEEVFENLYKGGSIGIRCPDNSVAAMLLQQKQNAVVAPSANITGQPAPVNADEVLAQLSGRIELLLDGGPCKYAKNSTVARVGARGLEILRDGAYPLEELGAMSAIIFLFVCTGNSCRSPMAEGMFRRYLAEKLGCKVDHLDRIGYIVCSAGTMGLVGVPASPEAVTACATKGIDIADHESSALSDQLIDQSDFIFAMSRRHREHVIALSAKAAKKCVLLAEGMDIPDPIGRSQQFYDSCAEMIERAVKERISELII